MLFFYCLVEWTQNKVMKEAIFNNNVDDDSKTFDRSMLSRNAPLLKEATDNEMDFIIGNGT